MSTSLLVLQRYMDLVDSGKLEAAFNYLAEDVVYVTWHGVVEGKDNVVTYLRDNIRYLHFCRNFTRWRRVQHCADADLTRFAIKDTGEESYFGSTGYDSQGFATFEREGTISRDVKVPMRSWRLRETVVLRDDQVAAVTILRQL